MAQKWETVLAAGAAGLPFSWDSASANPQTLLTAFAAFNGAAAAGSYLPTMELVSDGGLVIASCPVAKGDVVSAGGSADVTFAPFLGSKGGGCCNTSASGDYQTFVLATGPDAVWPFNETAGVVAHDVSGNSHNASYGAPFTLAQPAGPPGTVAVQFPESGAPGGRVATGGGVIPSYTTNFAAGVWVRVLNSAALLGTIVGQGTAVHGVGQHGWELSFDNSNGKLRLDVEGGVLAITSDAVVGVNTGGGWKGDGLWHLVGINNVAGQWQMYVDGAKQSGVNNTAITGVNTMWFAQDGFGGTTFYLAGQLSWGFVWSRPLTASEWAGLATPNGNVPAHWLLQSNGAGGSTYAPFNSGTAPAGYRLAADGNGGSYWAP